MSKVYIDYDKSTVYWSIEEIKDNPRVLRNIFSDKISNSDLIKIAKNEISFDKIIEQIFKTDKQGDYQTIDTDSNMIFVDWDDCLVFTELNEIIESYPKAQIFEYVANIYENDIEKFYSEISQGTVDLKQIYFSFLEDTEYIGIYVRK